MRAKCVARIQGEYITVGQEYEYTEEGSYVSYHRPTDGAGSFMSKRSWDGYVQAGQIVLIGE